MSVMVPDELDQDVLELAPMKDQKTVETLSADGPYEPLGESVCTGRSDWSATKWAVNLVSRSRI